MFYANVNDNDICNVSVNDICNDILYMLMISVMFQVCFILFYLLTIQICFMRIEIFPPYLSLQADVLVERRGEYEKERLPSNIKIGIPPPCIK